MQSQEALPPVVARFRERAREEIFPAVYSGPLHILFTTALCLGTITLAITQLSALRPLEWLTLPLTFLVGNLGEYLGHRGPMHHPRRGLGRVYKRHTGEHHRFFTREAMYYADSRDFFMVLFPPVLQVFFLGGIATPLALLVFWLFSANAGWLFVATVMGYYFVYEILHFSHHLAPNTWLGRTALLARLRQHHAIHHDPRYMQRANFNISFPLCDWIMGTTMTVSDLPSKPTSDENEAE